MADEQQLIVDLRLRDNISLGLGKVKDTLGNLGDTGRGEAQKLSHAFANAGDEIRAKFAGLGADIKKGIGLGLGLGATQLVAQGARELTQAIGGSINAARDLTETVNKSKVVFGPAAAEIEKFGDTAATSLGLSKNAAIGFAATFGNLFVSLGVGAEKIAPMSQALVTLGSDLASFNNIQTDEALTSLRAALVGEFEPARRLGVALSALTVEAKAAELGFTKVNGAFTEGDKIAARYALIMAQTGTAQGDFARTSQDLANQQRILDAQLENVSAKLGKLSTPILTDLARILNNEVLPALGKLSEEDLPSFAENSEREIAELVKGLQDFAGVLQIPEIADLVRSTAGIATAAETATVASTDLSASFVAQERAMALAAEAAAILAADTEQLKGSATSATPAELALAKATIEAGEAHVGLAAATKAAMEAGSGNAVALARMAEATAADELATAKLKAAQDALLASLIPIRPTMLAAGDSADDFAGSLLRLADNAVVAGDELRILQQRLKATAGLAFTEGGSKPKIPGLDNAEGPGGKSAGESFLEGLILANENAAAAAARAAAARAEADRKAAEALAKAKANALAYAAVIRDKVAGAFDNAKRTADILFDKLHERHIRAINDAQKLAQTQHDAATQQINDALRVGLATNAAPVTEAERAQQALELARQRRDLGESLQSALASGDPAAIRSAQEALQSFNAAQRINALRLDQATKDAVAQEAARAAQKAADDQLAAAKLQAAKDIETENARARKQQADFDRQLAALKKRNEGASPAKAKADIAKLEEKFGITRDDKGFSHITDVAAAAVKRITPPLADVGVAAAGATPKLAGLAAAEVSIGRESVTAAGRLATFAKRLGELKLLELPIPEKINRPVTRQLETLERPRLSVEDVLANTIKDIPIPAPNISVGPINVYVAGSTLDGRLVGAAMASSQSPSATPGVRTGILAPRP